MPDPASLHFYATLWPEQPVLGWAKVTNQYQQHSKECCGRGARVNKEASFRIEVFSLLVSPHGHFKWAEGRNFRHFSPAEHI